jgi:hypothetical protein
MEEYFLSLRKFMENSKLVNIEEAYYIIEKNNNNLIENNKNLSNRILDLENIIKEKDLQIKNKDEEIASYRKSSILSAMSKQVDDLKSYVSILEKQVKNYKIKNENSLEVKGKEEILEIPIVESIVENKDNEKEDNDEKEEEYETIEFKGKLYYKIKKRIYKINKDKSLGVLFARIKNGEIVKEN